LLGKDYMIVMKNKVMSVIYKKGNLVLKAPMSKNRTFKIDLDVMEHKCLIISSSRDEIIWHYRFGHLNFKDLNQMQRHMMVTDLPEIQIPDEICEDCLQSKQC